jgi:drug/metabolite transporter (DMT)-like permease
MAPEAGLAPPHSKRSEAFAASMLVVACLCWGEFFSLAKNWQVAAKATCPGGDLVATLTLLGIRPILALAVFAVVRPQLFHQPTRREWQLACCLGLLNFSGNVLQVWGLSATSPALSGFFTSMASLWVPVIALVFLHMPIAGATWIGLALGVAGLAVLGIDTSQGISIGQGEALTALSSLIFAVFILCLDRFGRRVRSSNLTLGLIMMAGLPALPMALGLSASGEGVDAWFFWLRDMLSNPALLRDVVLLTLFSTVIATFLMGTFQPRVPPSRAALIYLLEPVFAATISVCMQHDDVTYRLVLGGLLILGGNALAELPAWLLQRTREK